MQSRTDRPQELRMTLARTYPASMVLAVVYVIAFIAIYIVF